MSNPFGQQFNEVVLRTLEDLGTPISLGVAIRYRYGEWDQLAAMQIDPRLYSTAHALWRDSQAVNLLRKLKELPTTVDREAAAMDAFFACEAQCYRSNERLSPLLNSGLPDPDCGVAQFFLRVRKIAKSILGPVPVDIHGRFGPGATYADRGVYTTIPDKMSTRPTFTSSAWLWLRSWSETAWHRTTQCYGRHPEAVRGNRFTTVPKDCLKDRGIAVEPSINLYYQLGVGREIRRRLGVTGINLRRGKEIHMQVACRASKHLDFVTIDLSNASDTISRSLVELCLPTDWFKLLDSLRSPTTLVQGKTYYLEKFSSMGNGFTFELETLVFLCLILACPSQDVLVPGHNVFVYGDDIIVPRELSDAVMSVLKFSGLTPNAKKTFTDGNFRESCGGDFFGGVDVRPFFLEELPVEPHQLIAFANGLRRSGHTAGGSFDLLRRAWHRILDQIPVQIRRCRGPGLLGDLVIHDDDVAKWRCKRRSSIRYIQCWRPVPKGRIPWEHWSGPVVHASALYGVDSGASSTWRTDANPNENPHVASGGIIPRNPVIGYKLGWVPFS